MYPKNGYGNGLKTIGRSPGSRTYGIISIKKIKEKPLIRISLYIMTIKRKEDIKYFKKI